MIALNNYKDMHIYSSQSKPATKGNMVFVGTHTALSLFFITVNLYSISRYTEFIKLAFGMLMMERFQMESSP